MRKAKSTTTRKARGLDEGHSPEDSGAKRSRRSLALDPLRPNPLGSRAQDPNPSRKPFQRQQSIASFGSSFRRPASARGICAAVASSLCAMLLIGCLTKDDRHAGVDDFPNSIYARVNGFLAESKKSDAINPVPGVTDSLLGQQAFNVAAAKGAAKVAAASEAAVSESILPKLGLAKIAADSAGCTNGIITITDSSKSGDKITKDSLYVCMDAKALDSIKGNETLVKAKSVNTYVSTGRVESITVTDADGDGILNPVSGRKSKSKMDIVAVEGGIMENTVIVVGPGPDNNFNTEPDNVLYSVNWSKTKGADTLGSAVYADADSDGVVIDNAKPSLVDLNFFQSGPSKDNPDALWSRVNMRLMVRYKAEGKDVRRVHVESQTSDGRSQFATVKNLQGGLDFNIQDTLSADFLVTASSLTDTLDSIDTKLKMTVGKDFDDKSDDSVYAIDVHARKKLGEERKASFAFISNKPIPSGKDPRSGVLAMEVDFIDSTSLQVNGKITDSTMDVTVVGRDGKRSHVVWDRLGRGLVLDPLP